MSSAMLIRRRILRRYTAETGVAQAVVSDREREHGKKMDIYRFLNDLSDPCARMLTVAEGIHAGEKGVLSDGRLVFCSAEDGFLAEHADELSRLEGSGLTEIGGETVYSELQGRESRLVICGAGHVSMALITLGKLLGFETVVADDRLQFVNNAMERGADRVIYRDFSGALSEVEGDSGTYFIIATRGHRCDLECLFSIVKKEHAYIGLLGSKKRTAILKNELAGAGTDRELIDSIHMPIGLSIGAETPEEIAVAVMAEIIAIKNKRSAVLFDRDILEGILKRGGEKLVLATIVSKNGSAPRETGTKMLVRRDGEIRGTIGGGCIEGGVIAKARRMLISGGPESAVQSKPVIVDVNISTEAAENEGMACGGSIKVMLELIDADPDA